MLFNRFAEKTRGAAEIRRTTQARSAETDGTKVRLYCISVNCNLLNHK